MRISKTTLVFVVITTVLLVAVAILLGTNAVGVSGTGVQEDGRADADPLETLETGTTDELTEAFSTVANAVQPQIVQIETEQVPEVQNPFQGTPFEEFFGGPGQSDSLPPVQGLGSGVIVREDGYIVTNNHVVSEADEIAVRLAEGETYEAELVGTDPSTDLAVVKIDADDLPVIPYADAESVEVGNWVLAVGSPFSPLLGSSVTAGIISATGRAGFANLAQGETPFAAVQDFIQTDAAINPGNSGGGLVDLHGRLVGINTAIVSQTGGNVGIGFAIPIDIVRDVVPELIEQGYVARGFLGISYQSVTPALAEALGIEPGAAQVVQVAEGGPAAEAGLQAGDVIVSIAGETLESTAQLGTIIGSLEPGEQVEVAFIRDEERRTITVELGQRPTEQVPQAAGDEEPDGPAEATVFEDLGIQLADLTPQRRQDLASQLGIPVPDDLTGVLVTDVQPGAMAYDEANLRPGLVITQVEGQSVDAVQQFQEIYDTVEPGNYFRLTVAQPTPMGDWGTFQTALEKPNGSPEAE